MKAGSLLRRLTSFLAATAFASSALALDPATTDLNGDGRSDILWRNTGTGQVYRMLMSGGTIAAAQLVYSEPYTAWRIVGDADFNGDGFTDLLWRSDVAGTVFVQLFNASAMPAGGGVVVTEPSHDWKIVATPDINGDGRADILWWNASTGQVFAMLMNGAAIAAQGTVHTEPNVNWRIVAVGDFAGSGRANQLVWRRTGTGQIYLMTVNFAGGVFTQTGQTIYTEPNSNWRILGTGDFNGDNRSDVLWRHDTTGQVYVMLMNGPTISMAGIVHTEPDLDWKIVAIGDYDGDARSDLLWRNFATGQVYMMLMNGLAIASQGLVYTEPEQLWRIQGAWDYSDDDLVSGFALNEVRGELVGTFALPGWCDGNPKVNCPSGASVPTPITLGSPGQSTAWSSISGYHYSFYFPLVADNIRIDYDSGSGVITCLAHLDNAPGASTSTLIGGYAIFYSQYIGGTVNRFAINARQPTLEAEDLTVTGGAVCNSVWGIVQPRLAYHIELWLQEHVSPTFCGAPSPDFLGKCPQ